MTKRAREFKTIGNIRMTGKNTLETWHAVFEIFDGDSWVKLATRNDRNSTGVLIGELLNSGKFFSIQYDTKERTYFCVGSK